MPEELRIIVTDTVGPGGGSTRVPGTPRAPSVPSGVRPSIPVGVPVPSRTASTAGSVPVPSRTASTAGSVPGGGAAVLTAFQAGRGVGAAAVGGSVTAAASGISGIAGLTGVAAIAAPIGIAVAAVTVGFAIAVKAVSAFARKVESETVRLAEFSGVVATAQAQTDIRRTFASLRRAQQIGPELAAAENLRSRFETAITDLGTEILEVLLTLVNSLAPAIEIVIAVIKKFEQFLDENGAVIQAVLGQIFGVGIIRLLASWLNIQLDQDQPGDVDPFFREFFNAARGPAAVAGFPVPPPIVGGPLIPVGP